VAVTANDLLAPRLDPREVSVTFACSLLLHGALIAGGLWLPGVFFAPRVITVPVSYTVSLVSSLPSPPGRATPTPSAPPVVAGPAAPPPTPSAPPAAARPAPPPPPADDLVLPGRQAPRKAAPAPEASLRPSTTPRAPSPPLAPPAPPAAKAAPARPAPSIPGTAPPLAPPAPTVASAPPDAENGSKISGPELAGNSTGAGAGGGSALGLYLTLVDRKIQENWVPVGAAPLPETVVLVRFRVLRSGQVRDLELESGAGLRSLDEAALRAVRQSLPLPPFPNLLAEPYLDLRYRFVMEH